MSKPKPKARAKVKQRNYPVAVIGMHGRFPQAYDARDFWTNLYEGRNAFGLVPKERWDWEKLFGSSANESESTTINCAAFMPHVDRFDSRFFGIMPREAEAMDPQQRLFMQTAYAALEDAGYAPGSLAGTNTGVFVGIGNADYPGMMRQDGAAFDIYRATGLALTCIPNRVSFFLNVHGPSEAIDTACSGSLVAMHRAIQSMQLGECGMAIAGGVNLLAGPDLFIAFDKAGMLSKSARCRTFDAGANGYVRGEGVAALVLKPLDQAEQDGDYIYAVIHGSAVNHGGRAHSFTAPNAAAQAEVVKAAWQRSGKNFHDAFMIETHGTGTPLGDPIEVNGLKKVSEEFGWEGTRPSIALGALKSHVGHMEAAAGVGGIIKAILSMKNRAVPQNLNFMELNPHIDLNGTPFYVPSRKAEIEPTRKQQDGSSALLAGVSSFGFGGVNAHVVLESYDEATVVNDEGPYLIPLSARDKNGLQGRVRQLIHFLQTSVEATGTPTVESVFAALCKTLDIDPSMHEPVTLISLKLSPRAWAEALAGLGSHVGRKIELAEVIDCITLQEVAEVIARNAEIGGLHNAGQTGLCTRVALPDGEIRGASLGRIACSLMHGRDTFKERLACITHSKQELLDLLRAYLDDPEASHAWLWTHSVRSDDAVIHQPEAPQGRAGVEALATWAIWWVHMKSPVLDWDVLYSGTPMPRRFPLPAYPFVLDHIWYKPGVSAESISQPQAGSGPIAQQPVFLPTQVAAAWETLMRTSVQPIPSSVVSLAYLLDYAAYKSGGMVALDNMVFGPPRAIRDQELAFGYTPASGILQCLASKTGGKALAQASLKTAVEPRHEIPALASGNKLPVSQVLASLGAGSSMSALHCIQGVHGAQDIHGSRERLSIDVALPVWKARNGHFWVPLIAAMLAGCDYLRGTALQLPWKIRSVFFNSQAAAITTIHLTAGGGTVSAIALDKDARPVLCLDGIMLRAMPALVQQAVSQPEARAA